MKHYNRVVIFLYCGITLRSRINRGVLISRGGGGVEICVKYNKPMGGGGGGICGGSENG